MGDQQLEGIEFLDMYAPVFQWTTAQLMLNIDILVVLKSKQGDVAYAS